jgi:hypothetical protein
MLWPGLNWFAVVSGGCFIQRLQLKFVERFDHQHSKKAPAS